jgi:hypothetical protein
MTLIQKSAMLLEVDGDDAETLQADLGMAVALAESASRSFGGGVLVTQHDYWSFTVAVSTDVPHGRTIETRAWRSAC